MCACTFSFRGMNAIDRLQELTRPTGEEDLLAVRYPAPRVSVPVKPAAVVVAALLLLALSIVTVGSAMCPRWKASCPPSCPEPSAGS